MLLAEICGHVEFQTNAIYPAEQNMENCCLFRVQLLYVVIISQVNY
jgi:hypothetical protein